MTEQEWLAKRREARQEFDELKTSGNVPNGMNFEQWRVTKGYIVDGKPSEGNG